MVIPMSRTPGSDDHNGDRMIVKMILIAVTVRPMSRAPGSDQKIGDTQVDQVEVDCRSHVPATKSSTSTSPTTLSATSSSSLLPVENNGEDDENISDAGQTNKNHHCRQPGQGLEMWR